MRNQIKPEANYADQLETLVLDLYGQDYAKELHLNDGRKFKIGTLINQPYMYVVLRNSFRFVFFHSFFQKSSRDGDYFIPVLCCLCLFLQSLFAVKNSIK